MKVFFYAAGASDDGRQYLKSLLHLSELKDITLLSGKSFFLSPMALKIRSGDLLIIYAGTKEELDELIPLKNEFIDFRTILILAENDPVVIYKAHQLHPSFIVFKKEKTIRIEAVIKKMAKKNSV